MRKKFYEHSCCSVLLLLINFTPYPHRTYIQQQQQQTNNNNNNINAAEKRQEQKKKNAENTRATTNVEQNCAAYAYLCNLCVCSMRVRLFLCTSLQRTI